MSDLVKKFKELPKLHKFAVLAGALVVVVVLAHFGVS